MANFIQAFAGTHRYILDYLLEEVLQRQPEHVQAFLLQTALLDQLTAPLCDALGFGTAETQSQTMLEWLERDNLFIVPLDDERRWYRYHRLFADLLRARLRLLHAERVPTLHRRASEWYEKEGFFAPAIDHALAAGDQERAMLLVERTGIQMLTTGRLTTLLGWLDSLTEEVVCSRPWLCVSHAWALLLTGQVDAVEPRLQKAVEVSRAYPERCKVSFPCRPSTPEITGHVAAIRAYAAALRGESLRAAALAHEALERLSEDDLIVRSVVAFTLGGVSLLNGDVKGASEAFAQAGTLGRAGGNIHLAISAISHLAALQVELGQLHQAGETLREALALGQRGGRPLPIAAPAYSGMVELLLEWNQLEEATRYATAGIELAAQWGNVDSNVNSHLGLARLLFAQGDPAGALAAIEKAQQLVDGYTAAPNTAPLIAASRVQVWLGQVDQDPGRLAAAAEWARENQPDPDEELHCLDEFLYLTVAQVLIAMAAAQPEGAPRSPTPLGEAAALLARLRETAEREGRVGGLIQILALQAVALQLRGENTAALASLEQALALAEAEGYVQVFVSKGPPMQRLLREASSLGVRPGYVGTLLTAFEGPRPAPEASPAPTDLLSQREVEVLRLVAAGLSNHEVAETLVIALSTVKSHLNHIYAKLDVRSRTQAVGKARELGLL